MDGQFDFHVSARKRRQLQLHRLWFVVRVMQLALQFLFVTTNAAREGDSIRVGLPDRTTVDQDVAQESQMATLRQVNAIANVCHTCPMLMSPKCRRPVLRVDVTGALRRNLTERLQFCNLFESRCIILDAVGKGK